MSAIGAPESGEEDGADIILEVTPYDDDAGAELTVSVMTSNAVLFPDGSITFDPADPVSSGETVTVMLTPADDGNGEALVTVNVSDGSETITQQVTVTVDPVNDAPVMLALENQTTLEDHSISITLNATDIDNASSDLSFDASTENTDIVTVSMIGSVLTMTPVENATGPAEIEVWASDGEAESEHITFTLTVTAVNDAPELAAIGVQSTNEDTPLDITLSATDVDEDALTYTASSDEDNVTAVVDGTTLTLTPADNWSGTANITVTVNDGNGEEDDETFEFMVNAVDDAPVVSDIPGQTIDEGGSFATIDLDDYLTEVDGDQISWNINIPGGELLVEVDTENIATVSTPYEDWFGSGLINFQATDNTSEFLSDSDDATFTVNPINDPPEVVMAIEDVPVDEDSAPVVLGDLDNIFGDVDSELFFTFTNDNEALVTVTVDEENAVTLTFTENGNGTANITFTADDGEFQVTDEVLVTVTATNDPPEVVAAIEDLLVDEDSAPVVLGDLDNIFGDIDSDLAFTYSNDNESLVTVTIDDDNAVILTFTGDASGTANLTFSAWDGEFTVTDEVPVTVTAINDPPGVFALISPANDSTITIDNDNTDGLLTFSWEEPDDVEGDAILFRFEGTGIFESISQDSLETAELVVIYADLIIALGEEEIVTGTWTVYASDAEDTTIVSNGPFTLTIDGSSLEVNEELFIPDIFALHQNYPNPFNPVTTIAYDVPEMTSVRVDIYNILGQQVRTLINRSHEPGYYRIQWDGTNDYGEVLPSGMYIYSIQASGFTRVKKLVLMK
jgi:VCBS repeat-containing protein